MSSDPSNPLSHHHRETIDRIFQHPTSGNIEWRQVRSLLEAVGTVTEEHSGRIVVASGGIARRSTCRATRTSTTR